MRKKLTYVAIIVLLAAGCGRKEQGGTPAASEQRLRGGNDTSVQRAGHATNVSRDAQASGVQQPPATTGVADVVSQFDRALAALKALQEGRTPADSDLPVLLEMARQPDQLLPYVHDAVYVLPREGLLAREQERHDKVIWLCTNVAFACADPEACNELLHTAGSAAERRAKLTPNSTPEECAERKQYWELAKELYHMVIQRAEAGIAVREAADSALFLGDIYAQEDRDADAEAAYRLFMRFSAEIEQQPSNVEFGAIRIALLTFSSNPQRTERLLREILNENPHTIHREWIGKELENLKKAATAPNPPRNDEEMRELLRTYAPHLLDQKTHPPADGR